MLSGGPSRGSGAPHGRPRADRNYFFSCPKRSKRAPRGSQELFRGFRVEEYDSGPILVPFWGSKMRPRGLKKTLKSLQVSLKIKVLPF